MDLIIPYRALGDDGESIKFTLRSAASFFDFDSLWIVGDNPSTLDPSTYNYIPCQDEPRGANREKNIFKKVFVACMEDKISEDFICMHDDHFSLTSFRYGIPYYFSRAFDGNEIYQNTVKNTIRIFPSCKNFDVHFPIVFNKEKFLNTVAKLDWRIPFGYCIKTSYCTMNDISGLYHEDCKIRKPYLNTDNLIQFMYFQKWFSIDDKAMNQTMLDALGHLYNYKTKYEYP
jgi:hypothetical protein